MRMKLLSGWLCWVLVLTAAVVFAESPVPLEREPPKVMRVMPDSSRQKPLKKLPDPVIRNVGKPGAAVDLKITRVFVVTVVNGVEYTGVHAPQVPVGTFYDLCCEFSVAGATLPLAQDWKIGLFLDGSLRASRSGNDFASTGHVCQPGGQETTPVAHSYECVLDHTGLVPESVEGNNRGSASFSIVP